MANELLTAFLFRLARDNVPFGVIEEHVAVVETAHVEGEEVEYAANAVHMGEWAREVAARLTPVRRTP